MGPILAKRSLAPLPSSPPPADAHPPPPSKKPTLADPARVKKKKRTKSKPKLPADDPPPPVERPLPLVKPPTTTAGARPAPFLPLSRFKPPQCCPPDRCTGDVPNHFIWPELDGLLYETCLAGYKCASPCRRLNDSGDHRQATDQSPQTS